MENNIFLQRSRPWDGLGTLIGNARNWAEAQELAGLAWKVRQEDLYSEGGVKIEGFKVNIKDDDNTVLGVVSNKYNLVQNDQAFAFLDELLMEARFDCGGVVQNGKRTWISMKLPDYIICGERHSFYLVITNSFDTSSALRFSIVSIRCLCANTINLALKNAQRTFYIAHSSGANEKLEAVKDVLIRANNYMEQLGKEIENLNRKMIPEEQAMSIIDELIPVTEEMSQIQINNVYKLRNDIKFRYKQAPDLIGMENTAYKLYNSISDHVYHTENPLRKTAGYKESLFIKAIDGNPLLDRAYELIKVA